MSLLHKSLYMSGGRILVVALSMLTNIIYSRYLGPAGVGQYELLQSTGIMVMTFYALGVGNATIFFVNNLKVEIARVLNVAIRAALVLGGLLCLTLTALIIFFTSYFGYVSLPIALVFSFGAACLLGTCYFRPVLIAQMREKRSVMVDLAPRLTTFTGGGILALMGVLNTEIAIALLGLGNLSSCVLALIFLKKDISLKGGFDWKLFSRILSYGIKLSSANLMFVLSGSIGVMLLRVLLPNDFASVGLYVRAAGVCGMITLIPESIAPLLYAKWASVTGEVRARQGERALRMGIFTSVCCLIGLVIFGRLLITLLYGQSFADAYSALVILAPGLIAIVLFNTCNQMFASDGNAMVTTYVLVFSTIVACITAYFAVPVLGFKGAALATLAGNVTASTCSIWLCSKQYQLRISKCLLLNYEDWKYIKSALLKKHK